MKKKRLKINWLNVIKLIVFIICVSMIIHDLYLLTIYSFITGNLYGWSWFGLLTFILFCSIADIIYEDFEEQIKSIQSYRPKHAKDTTDVNNI